MARSSMLARLRLTRPRSVPKRAMELMMGSRTPCLMALSYRRRRCRPAARRVLTHPMRASVRFNSTGHPKLGWSGSPFECCPAVRCLGPARCLFDPNLFGLRCSEHPLRQVRRRWAIRNLDFRHRCRSRSLCSYHSIQAGSGYPGTAAPGPVDSSFADRHRPACAHRIVPGSRAAFPSQDRCMAHHRSPYQTVQRIDRESPALAETCWMIAAAGNP